MTSSAIYSNSFSAYTNSQNIEKVLQASIDNINANELLFPNVDYSSAYDTILGDMLLILKALMPMDTTVLRIIQQKVAEAEILLWMAAPRLPKNKLLSCKPPINKYKMNKDGLEKPGMV